MVDFEHLKRLCERRKQVGSVPWIDGNKSRMNAKVELDRIDGLIVEEVMKLYAKREFDNVQSVVRGKWFPSGNWNGGTGFYRCSICMDDVFMDEGLPTNSGFFFCPHCGADLREVETDG